VIRVVLACGGQKQTTPAPALELYTGPLFADARRWALSVTSRDRIFILSALHGLIAADKVIAPYDVRLAPISPARALELADQAGALELLGGPVWFAGGAAYRWSLVLAGLDVRAVTDALPPGREGRGIGAQRQWYRRNAGQLPATVQP
jgi:hypothetical protein